MNNELATHINAFVQDWFQLSFARIINVHELKEGDIIVVRTAEFLDSEVLMGVRQHLLSLRPDLKVLGIMNVGMDEDIEVVHQRMLDGPK